MAYPMEAIGGALLIISAAVSNHFDRSGNSAVTIPLYCAVAFSLAGLALTAKAAPIMLGLTALQSGSATQSAFDEFFLWVLYLRGIAIVLTFVAVTWSLADLNGDHSNSR